MQNLLLLQLALSGYFTGIIWLVQTVVYPLMLKIPKSSFGEYHSAYTGMMGWVVGPLMILELGLSVLMLFLFREAGAWNLRWIALGLTGIC